MTQNQATHPFSRSTNSWREQLDHLVGLTEVKQQVIHLEKFLKDRNERQEKGTSPQKSQPYLHLAFMGNPGTGKTTIARLVGEMYRDLGLLNKGHIVEVNYADLTDEYVGGSAKRTRERIQEAIDGVLFIDEAYQLSTNQFGQEVITTLLKPLEDDRARLVVVLAGYTEPMKELFDVNIGLRNRIPKQNEIIFPDYAPDELFDIFQRFITEKGLIPSPEFNQTLNQIITQMYKYRDIEKFGNARTMRGLADEVEKLRVIRRRVENLSFDTPIIEADLPESARAYLTITTPDINEIMAELNDLIGLDEIKRTVKELVNDLETRFIRVTLGQPIEQSSINLVFSGNPGTGKTTVAKLMGKILKSVGVLRKGHMIVVRASDLFAGYLGQTAAKTEEVCKQALDGVLFIDEAYELVPKSEQDTYRRDAIGVLMRYMDTYPDRLAVIAAGYPQDMQDFIASNPGLTRRFSTFTFPDYSNAELLDILQLKVSAHNISFPTTAAPRALYYFEKEREHAIRNGEPFINASLVDRLLSIMKTNQNKRYMETREPSLLKSFTPDDIPKEFEDTHWIKKIFTKFFGSKQNRR